METDDTLDLARLSGASMLAGIEHYPSIGSTQTRAHELAGLDASAGRRGPVLIVADEQTAGRGRGVNAWWTGCGSLALSLLFDGTCFGLPRQPLPQGSLAAGIAVVDTVSPWLPGQIVGLHWPNDVFAAGRKLSGILIDVLPDGRHILGIGLNVNNVFVEAPAEVQSRAVSLVELAGRPMDRTDVLLTLLDEIRGSLSRLAVEPDAFGLRFDEACLQVGHDLTIENAGQRTTGRCAGIAADGALLLDTFSGRQKFYSGVLR